MEQHLLYVCDQGESQVVGWPEAAVAVRVVCKTVLPAVWSLVLLLGIPCATITMLRLFTWTLSCSTAIAASVDAELARHYFIS